MPRLKATAAAATPASSFERSGCRTNQPRPVRVASHLVHRSNLFPNFSHSWQGEPLRPGGIARRVFARLGRTTVAGGAASRSGRASHRMAAVAPSSCLWCSARLRADDSCIRVDRGAVERSALSRAGRMKARNRLPALRWLAPKASLRHRQRSCALSGGGEACQGSILELNAHLAPLATRQSTGARLTRLKPSATPPAPSPTSLPILMPGRCRPQSPPPPDTKPRPHRTPPS